MRPSINKQPEPQGGGLSDQVINKIAETYYRRFIYEYGTRPQWCDLNVTYKNAVIHEVRKTLDAITYSNLTVI